MDQQAYSALGLFLSTVTCGVLLALYRRSGQRAILLWLGAWLSLALHYGSQYLAAFDGRPLAREIGGVFVVFAAVMIVAMAEQSPLLPGLRTRHFVAAGAGVVVALLRLPGGQRGCR